MKLNFQMIFLVSVFIYMSDIHAQDWPNLQRYQKENINLLETGLDSSRVVFMGNSITEGWAKIRPEFFKNSSFVNRGISGQTTPQMLLRFRQDVISLNPEIVVILAGINDIAGNTGPMTIEMIIDNYKSMLQLALTNKIRVVVCSVLPASHFNWRPQINPTEKVIQLNEFLKSTAKNDNVTYVDYHSAMKNKENGLRKELGEDGVHPNSKGYAIMESLITQALTQLRSND